MLFPRLPCLPRAHPANAAQLCEMPARHTLVTRQQKIFTTSTHLVDLLDAHAIALAHVRLKVLKLEMKTHQICGQKPLLRLQTRLWRFSKSLATLIFAASAASAISLFRFSSRRACCSRSVTTYAYYIFILTSNSAAMRSSRCRFSSRWISSIGTWAMSSWWSSAFWSKSSR